MNTSVFKSFPEIYLSRIFLRELTSEDVLSIHKLRSDPEIMRFMDTNIHSSLNHSEAFVQKSIDSFYNHLGINWGISLNKKDPIIGYIGIWRIDAAKKIGEIGFALMKSHWQKGLMTEALGGVSEFAFNDFQLSRLMADVNPDNEASIRLLETNGFRKDQLIRNSIRFQGRYIDSLILVSDNPAL